MPADDKVEVSLSKLRSLLLQNLRLIGLSEDEAIVVADVILYAELRDKSQGLIKVIEKTLAPAADRSSILVESRAAAINLVHANGHAGMVVLNRATSVTIDTCTKLGLALTGTRGTATSTGSIGYYAERMAAAGLVGIVMAGSPKVMAVSGSLYPSMGTNPLAIAVPTNSDPLVFDMATAATTWFDLLQLAREDQAVQPGVALTRSGEPALSAAQALQGVLQAFGGSKGSGLALMLEMLTGPLMGATVAGDPPTASAGGYGGDSRGCMVLAIDPSVLAPDFTQRASQIIEAIHVGPKQTGRDSVRLPGERSAKLARTRLQSGTILVDRGIYRQLLALVKG